MNVTVFDCDQDEAATFRAQAARFAIAPVMTSVSVSADSARFAHRSRCVSVGHKTPLTATELTALRDAGVAYISTRSAGIDHIDTDFAGRAGITVENVAYSPDSVADHSVLLMLMALRRMKAVAQRVAARDFRSDARRGAELRDLTVGVVGTGRIGSAVIDRLHGFGCPVLAHDRRPTESAENVSFDDLLRRSDIVTLHTPLTPSTHHLLDRAAFARMKPGAYLINTARGGVVDSTALLEALDAGHLTGAALDVVDDERGVFYVDRRRTPLENTTLARLLDHPDVIVTPHIAYFTDHALTDAVVNSLTNCRRFEERMLHDQDTCGRAVRRPV